MNKTEASVSLFIITFFASIQYIFLAGVPENLSHFAFLSITNLIGFFMTLAFFFGELFRLDAKQIKQSIILSAELVFFNIFMLMGVRGIEPAITSAVLSVYFIFILIFDSIISKKLPDKISLASVGLILPGLFLMTNANISGLYNTNILYLILADIFFAIYVMTVGSYASSSNPSILAMGQMFFCFIFSFLLWSVEAAFTGTPLFFPVSKEFWVSVIYISFFIRGLYGIIQIYAQRYITPLNTSLIFSSEIVMTLLMSPLLATIFNTKPERVTTLKIIGSVLIIFGLLITNPDFFAGLENKIRAVLHIKDKSLENKTPQKIILREKISLIIISGIVYLLMDIPVRLTEILPFYASIKNSLPFILGLFFGFYGIIGICAGCFISYLIIGVPLNEFLTEIRCIITTGLFMFYGWHIFSKSHRINFKRLSHYLRYIMLTITASILCLDYHYGLSYFICGILIGLPTCILFGSLLYVEPILPTWCSRHDDADFILESGAENLEKVNEILQETAENKGLKMKRIFEIQSCLEELSIRIFNAIPDAKIYVRLIYYNAVSMRLIYNGVKYNPFMLRKGEDYMDIMSLNIIKHRALRASFNFIKGVNKVHVVM